MEISKLVKLNLSKFGDLHSASEDTKIDLICCELANIFGARKTRRMLLIDRDLLSDCLNELDAN